MIETINVTGIDSNKDSASELESTQLNFLDLLKSQLDSLDFESERGYSLAVSDLEQDYALATSRPDVDFFKLRPTDCPKKLIGKYLSSLGIKVPLIRSRDEWRQALASGRAMIRSELPQDYDGFSGVLSSAVLSRDRMSNNLDWSTYQQSKKYNRALVDLQLEHLADGQLSAIDYMLHGRGLRSWLNHHCPELEHFQDFSDCLPSLVDPTLAGVSFWRYVPGTSVKMFADPNVFGRFYFGVTPGGKLGQQTVGSYMFDLDEYDQPKRFRKHSQDFIARDCIEIYNQIQQSPLFDITQSPVLELKIDDDDQVHFLQYYKTGQLINYALEFELPNSPRALTTDNVRGATSPAGEMYRLFLAPTKLTSAMKNQALLYDHIENPQNVYFSQIRSHVFDFILHSAYISFQNNHFSDVNVYCPKIAAGLDGGRDLTDKALLEAIYRLIDDINWAYRQNGDDYSPYINIKLTSNGRRAVIESDWEIRT